VQSVKVVAEYPAHFLVNMNVRFVVVLVGLIPYKKEENDSKYERTGNFSL
jgi:hypothetical protein